MMRLATVTAATAVFFSSTHASLDPTPDCTVNTPWSNYVCSLANRPAKFAISEACLPRSYTANTEGPVKGAVLLFHGYSACPDSFDPLALKLSNDGFHVYSFLTVGHGRVFENSCDDPEVDCAVGDPVDEMPTKVEDYEAFVNRAVAIFKDEFSYARNLNEFDHIASVAGLSVGGPLSLYALQQDEQEGFFSRAAIMNPFYGITLPFVDSDVVDCVGLEGEKWEDCASDYAKIIVDQTLAQANGGNATSESPQYERFQGIVKNMITLALPDSGSVRGGYAQIQNLVRLGISAIVRNPALLSQNEELGNLVQGPFGWGDFCQEQRANGRNGYCNFKVMNLFTVHAFSQKVLANAHKVSPRVKISYQLVQRDGLTRNGLNLFAVRTPFAVSGFEYGTCMFLTENRCAENTCGVPHSHLSRPENTIVEPFELYWEDNLHKDVSDFLQGTTGRIGVPDTGILDKARCTYVDTQNPDDLLFESIPLGATLAMEVPSTINSEDVIELNNVANQLAQAIGVEENWFMNIVQRNRARLSGSDEQVAETFRMEFNRAEDAQTLASAIRDGKVTTLENGARIISLEVDGVPPDASSDAVPGIVIGSVFGTGVLGLGLFGAWKCSNDQSVKRRRGGRSKPDKFASFRLTPKGDEPQQANEEEV